MSGNVNTVIMEGRASKDPVYRKTQSNKSVCRFSVANNKYFYSDGEVKNSVYFFDVVAWGKIAENAAINIHKGRHVFIEGELRQESYISKTGDKKQSIYVLANTIKYLDKKCGKTERVSAKHTVNKNIEEALEVSF